MSRVTLDLMRPAQARRVGRYWQILRACAGGYCARSQIAAACDMAVGPALIRYLDTLVFSGHLEMQTRQTRNGLLYYVYRCTAHGHEALARLEQTGMIEVTV